MFILHKSGKKENKVPTDLKERKRHVKKLKSFVKIMRPRGITCYVCRQNTCKKF
jgi:hypothetical protein